MPVRRKSYRPARGRRESLWQTRGTTIKYLLFVLGGLLLGSLAAVLCGVEAIPCQILINQLTAIPQRGLWALWRERLLFMAILLLYLMIAGRCLWHDPGGAAAVRDRAGDCGNIYADAAGLEWDRVHSVGGSAAANRRTGGAGITL